MVNWQLVQYIQDSIKKGYTYQQIRGYLIQNSWPQALVDEAINYVYHESVQDQYNKDLKPKSHITYLNWA